MQNKTITAQSENHFPLRVIVKEKFSKMNKLKAMDICDKYSKLDDEEKYKLTYSLYDEDIKLECHY